MHYLSDGSIHLELSELIRMNRLVRGRIDMEGFQIWHDALPPQEQGVLLCRLHKFAQQAGYKDDIYEQALQDAQLVAEHPLVRHLCTFRGGYSEELGVEQVWLSGRTAEERRQLLPFLAYLFGYAEGRVYSYETEASCNHWWHRDLLDERVVNNLLKDPAYYRTTMRNDRAVKEH